MFSGNIIDSDKKNSLLSNVNKTANAFERMRGLLFRPKLTSMQALWIEPCPSVHTFGMRYSIDVIFLDKNGNVLKVVDDLPPMRMAMCKDAIATIELLAGDARKLQIQTGMKLNWQQKEKIK